MYIKRNNRCLHSDKNFENLKSLLFEVLDKNSEFVSNLMCNRSGFFNISSSFVLIRDIPLQSSTLNDMFVLPLIATSPCANEFMRKERQSETTVTIQIN